MHKTLLQKDIERYIKNPTPKNNYHVGLTYSRLGQFAAANGFLMKSAENYFLPYECLCLIALNMRQQGNRDKSVKNSLMHAISYNPKRPEAYFLLSRAIQESNNQKDWHESYTYACIGLSLEVEDEKNATLDYAGKYVLAFQKAVAGWWVGHKTQSENIFNLLLEKVKMDKQYAEACRNNLMNLGCYFDKTLPYYKINNYSQIMQDVFALKVNEYSLTKNYLEIGANHPIKHNNTYLLEKEYGWKGVSIEISDEHKEEWIETRENFLVLNDALTVDYYNILKQESFISYLQIDCDPADVSLKVLEKIFQECSTRFGCITFEHDRYANNDLVLEKSRSLLKQKGYIMVADNVGTDVNTPFEDWWVDCETFKNSNIKTLVDEKNKTPDKYLDLYN